jgi:hypothetical protein
MARRARPTPTAEGSAVAAALRDLAVDDGAAVRRAEVEAEEPRHGRSAPVTSPA